MKQEVHVYKVDLDIHITDSSSDDNPGICCNCFIAMSFDSVNHIVIIYHYDI
jgi:hypothetical protein